MLASRFYSRLLIAALLFAFIPISNPGQGIPWYTIPLPIPKGFVDGATGNIHFEIPLSSLPQRNGDPFVSKIIYDSAFGTYNGWTATLGNSHGGTGSMNSQASTCTDPGYPNGTITTYSGFYFQDAHFTIHAVVNSNIYTKLYNCFSTGNVPDPNNAAGIYSSAFGVAADSSGYYFTVTNYTQMKIYAADGTLVYDNTGDQYSNEYPLDPNGNYGTAPNTSVLPNPNVRCSAPGTYTSTGKASDGSTLNFTLTCTAATIAVLNGGYQQTFSVTLLATIGLPDGTQYSFTYDTGTTGTHDGDMLSMTLPSGGVISFTHVPYFQQPVAEFGGRVASVSNGSGTWNLSYVLGSNNLQVTTTVLSPQRYDSASKTYVSDKTVFTSIPNADRPVQTTQYYSGSSTLLKTVTITYDPNGNLLPMAVTTTLNDSGLTSSVSYQYFNLMRHYPTQKQETDFSGAVIRTTLTQYGAPAPFLKPDSINVYAGSNTSGTPISSTLYKYDEYSANYCKNGVPMLTSVTGAYGHDDTFGVSDTARGNVTTTQRLISGTTYATTHACYDTLGNVTQTVDGNGNPTTYSYNENWADSFCIPSGTVTHAFPTTITDALSHQTKYSYFTCTLLMQSDADQNQINAGKSTTYTYDMLERPLTINYPDGGQTTYCYSHDSAGPCYTTALPPFSTTSQLMCLSSNGPITCNNAPEYLKTKTLLDGYGRTVETQVTSDPDCASGDKTDTTYDGFGRVLTVSNPYCTTSDPTYGVSTYSYDALWRPTQFTYPDGTFIVTKYVGSATLTTDEGNGTQSVQSISQTDGLGRLTSVCEVAPGPFVGSGGQSSSSLIGYGSSGSPASCGLLIAGTGFLTNYQYDPLSNLLQVSQNGIGARTFSYDSLSRLVCASNPENSTAACPTTAPSSYIPGTTGYTFDANSNLSTRTRPLQNQPTTASVTTSYQYDALNRLTSKSYSDGSTPTASFAYDSTNNFPSLTNTLGSLVYSSVPSSIGGFIVTYSEYDLMGRVSEQFQYTPMGGANDYPMPYSYDLMGNMTSFSNGYFTYWYPSYNTAARLTTMTSSVSGSGYPGTLLSAAHYNAGGQITTDTLGTGETETFAYDKRLRLQSDSSALSGTSIYSFNLTFAPNGDVTAANDSVNGNWNYSYDQFNRLVCANVASNGTCTTPPTGTPTYTYVYDRFGNRWQQNTSTGGPYHFSANFTGNGTTNNNRLDGYSYDAAGNVLFDNTHHYFYDAENHLIQVDGTLPYCTSNGTSGTAATACYYYDAEGHRVHRTGVITDTCDGTGKRDYAFDLQGRWVGEYNSNGTGCKSEIYAGGRHLVTYGSPAAFDHTDWLGTSRLRNTSTNPTNLYETCTSLPFGDGLTCNSSFESNLHFTGQERDFESGLDNFFARYYPSSMGRFMSSDPDNVGASPDDPQSWNAYSYVLNNPLIFVDPDGLDCAYLNDAGTRADWIDHHSDIKECEQHGGYWANGWIANSSWVQTNPFDDNVLITSQFSNGGIGVSLASQTWTQGAVGFSEDAAASLFSFRQWTPLTSDQLAIKAIHDGLRYLPAVCSISVGIRLGKGNLEGGAQLTTDLGKNTSLRGNFRWKVFQAGSSSAGFSADGQNGGFLNYSYKIPETNLSVGFNTPGNGKVASLNASFRPGGKLANLTASVRLANAYECPQ